MPGMKNRLVNNKVGALGRSNSYKYTCLRDDISGLTEKSREILEPLRHAREFSGHHSTPADQLAGPWAVSYVGFTRMTPGTRGKRRGATKPFSSTAKSTWTLDVQSRMAEGRADQKLRLQQRGKKNLPDPLFAWNFGPRIIPFSEGWQQV